MSNPRAPVYIVSKGRATTGRTWKYLEEMGVPYHVVVEAAERDAYADVLGAERVLVLPQEYLDKYDTCDALGDTKSKGPGAARNFAWEHSILTAARWHWVMDDNIKGFYRLNHNMKLHVSDGTIFRAMEDFCARYMNVAMAGPQYHTFAYKNKKWAPFVLNTRIYSCNLIRNDVRYRWRGRYNEDTDLSLRMLKGKWCTVQFNAFLQDKTTTQVMKGGNNADFYEKEGTAPKSEMLVRLHPEVAKLITRWGRTHHYVDYRRFKDVTLVRRPGVEITDGVDEYGMELVAVADEVRTPRLASLIKRKSNGQGE